MPHLRLDVLDVILSYLPLVRILVLNEMGVQCFSMYSSAVLARGWKQHTQGERGCGTG